MVVNIGDDCWIKIMQDKIGLEHREKFQPTLDIIKNLVRIMEDDEYQTIVTSIHMPELDYKQKIEENRDIDYYSFLEIPICKICGKISLRGIKAGKARHSEKNQNVICNPMGYYDDDSLTANHTYKYHTHKNLLPHYFRPQGSRIISI